MKIINDVLKDKKAWKAEYDSAYNYFKKNIGEKELTKTVDIKFYKNDEEVITLLMTDYLVNLIMWQPYIKYKVNMDRSIIFDCNLITNDKIKNYLDRVTIPRLKKVADIHELNKSCAKIIEKLTIVGDTFGTIFGISFNLYDLIQLMKRNKRFNELVNLQIPEGLQPSEIEGYLDDRTDELLNIMKTEDNQFKPILNAEEGVKIKQLSQMLMCVGTMPDLEGNTYATPINTSILRGLNTPGDYLLDAEGGRKALIMNKLMTGLSGYFARNLNLLCSDVDICQDENYDCGTKGSVEYYVADEKKLKLIHGRYFRYSPTAMIYKIVDKYTDSNLIGKTIYLRSPSKCASKKGVCRKCYGDLYYINNYRHAGIIASEDISSRLTQNILSSKHLLATNSTEIKMNDDFERFFVLNGQTVFVRDDINLKRMYMRINLGLLEKKNEYDFDEENDGGSFIPFFKIVQKEGDKYTDVAIIKEVEDNALYITEYLDKLINRPKYISHSDNSVVLIPLESIDDLEGLFVLEVVNNELTKPLKDLTSLLDTKGRLGCETIDDMVNKMADLFLQSKLSSPLIHGEMVIRGLVRDDKDVLKRMFKKFKNDPNPTYQILSVKTALKKHPSVIVSLSFERVKEQLKSPLTFEKKESSLYDILFMDNYKKYIREEDLNEQNYHC